MTTRFSSPDWPRTKRSRRRAASARGALGARAVFKRLLGAILASAAMFHGPAFRPIPSP